MEIWIIEGGEKVGPIHDSEVRERISRGELGPDSMVWHEGRDGWIALKEVELFEQDRELAVLVEHEGESWTREMVKRAGQERMAPVLMTALTSGIGLLPCAEAR